MAKLPHAQQPTTDINISEGSLAVLLNSGWCHDHHARVGHTQRALFDDHGHGHHHGHSHEHHHHNGFKCIDDTVVHGYLVSVPGAVCSLNRCVFGHDDTSEENRVGKVIYTKQSRSRRRKLQDQEWKPMRIWFDTSKVDRFALTCMTRDLFFQALFARTFISCFGQHSWLH